jgi:hypothetical protein
VKLAKHNERHVPETKFEELRSVVCRLGNSTTDHTDKKKAELSFFIRAIRVIRG